jgi:hypothetical protein
LCLGHLSSNKGTHKMSHKDYNEAYLIKDINPKAGQDDTENNHKVAAKFPVTPVIIKYPYLKMATNNTNNPNIIENNPINHNPTIMPKTPPMIISNTSNATKLSNTPNPNVVFNTPSHMIASNITTSYIIAQNTKPRFIENYNQAQNIESGSEVLLRSPEVTRFDYQNNPELLEKQTTMFDDDALSDEENLSEETAISKEDTRSEEAAMSIKRLREFITHITVAGETTSTYPAIKKILEIDTSSEEAVLKAAKQFCHSYS